jgi:hypothetical protein
LASSNESCKKKQIPQLPFSPFNPTIDRFEIIRRKEKAERMPHHSNHKKDNVEILKVRLGETIQMVSLLKSNAGDTKGSRRRWLKHLRLRIRAEFNLKMEDQFVVCYEDKMGDEITLVSSFSPLSLSVSLDFLFNFISKVIEIHIDDG